MIKKCRIFIIALLSTVLLFTGTGICHASASSKSFGYSGLSSAGACVDYSLVGFDSFGYYPRYTSWGMITDDEILDWISNTGNGYAFYIQTHGNDEYFEDAYGNEIYPDDCSGNWDLVFLDFSFSGYTSNFASALHTIGYSNRGFLGWYDEIWTTEADLFGYYFWIEETGYSPLYLSAIHAAASVPGDGSTPVSFYGDTSYYGDAR